MGGGGRGGDEVQLMMVFVCQLLINVRHEQQQTGWTLPEPEMQIRMTQLLWGWLLQLPLFTDCSLQPLKQAACYDHTVQNMSRLV